MLRDARFLAFADFRHLLRRRETWLSAFVLPVVFFYFVGTITANFESPDAQDRLAVFAPPGAGPIADHFKERLQKTGYRVITVSDRAALASYDRQLALPGDFTQAILNRQLTHLDFVRKDTGANGDYDNVRISRAMSAVLSDVAVVTREAKAVDAAAFAALDSTPRPLTLDVKPAGKRREIPSGFEQAVPGSLVFFLLLVLWTTGGATLVVEREQGLLKRLAFSPMSRGSIVLGKWGARMLLGVLQIAFSMITGSVLFHIHWGSHLPTVLILLLAYASFNTSAGLLIGSLAHSRAQAVAVGSVSANVLACLGGCWWPAEIMPISMQMLAKFTPTGLTMDALHQLVNFGMGPSAVLMEIVILTSAALIAGYFAARSFRFQ